MVNLPKISIDTESLDKCFGCGKDNPIGLKLSFQWDGKVSRAEFTPAELYQGWSGIIHGGIITCMLDEAMSHAAFFEGRPCVTATIEVKLKRPALVNEPLIVTASITRRNRRFTEARAAIRLKDGTLVAEGAATQFVVGSKHGSKSGGEGRREGDA